jgi:putative holliday junction resolvase
VSGREPLPGRVAGVDYGTVRIGVAISDPARTLASPLSNYTRRGPDGDARWFRELARQEQIALFIVGLPVFTSGDESPKSREARAFGQWLAETTGVPVEFYDERYTTSFANELLAGTGLTSKQRKERRDKLAAQILLTSWLESSRRETPPEALE